VRLANIAVVVALALLAACGPDEIGVRKQDDEAPADYGRTALLAAANKVASAPRSPSAYREFAVQVERLRLGFDKTVAETADLHLIFLALGPLEALYERPYQEQLEKLATTVWPTALGVQPRPGESPDQYLERICAAELAAQCKHAVPDEWPLLLTTLVWNWLRDRAEVAYTQCETCLGKSGYKKALETFEKRDDELSRRAGDIQDRAHPKHWPSAGPNARPFSDAPLLSRKLDGEARLRGTELRAGSYAQVLTEARGSGEVLGLCLHPKDRVRTLRPILEDAGKAGYREVALLVRKREYPYEKREYRLAVGGKARGQRVGVRDIDTIQVLVQALDVAARSSAGAPARL